MESGNVLTKGQIVYWNGLFGFIENEAEETIFFHKSGLKDINPKDVFLLDKVEYSVEKSNHWKHPDQPIAANINVINKEQIWKQNKADRSDLQFYVGRLIHWTSSNLYKNYGFIKSPQFENGIILYETRKVIRGQIIKENDLVVFCPVKSNKNPDQLFTFLAYSINIEEDVDFLQRQLQESQQFEIQSYIDKLIEKDLAFKDLPISRRFELELKGIGKVEDYKTFIQLKNKIVHYRKEGYNPPINVLRVYCQENYLFQLWESEIIDEYPSELIVGYFFASTADNKRFLAKKVSPEDKKRILNHYYNRLATGDYFSRINNDLKTFLDIVYRNKETREMEIFNEARKLIEIKLEPEELIELWIGGYIEDLSERFIAEHLKIDDYYSIKKIIEKGGIAADAIQKVFEDYFLEFDSASFDHDHSKFILRLLIFEQNFKNRFAEVLRVVKAMLKDHQNLILWIFGIEIFSNVDEVIPVFLKNRNKLIEYYKLKFFLNKNISPDKKEIKELAELADISAGRLNEFLINYEWNQLVVPTCGLEELNLRSDFIEDLKKFISIYSRTDININDVSTAIYNTMGKYNIHHVRLWLSGYVETSFYDYVGYRDLFRCLTKKEQDLFKKIGTDFKVSEDIHSHEFLDVKPCLNFQITNEYIKTYFANIENIYFGNNYFRLRMEDESFTEKMEHNYCSTLFNRIPETSTFNKMIDIQIQVKKIDSQKHIVEKHKGIDELIVLIHTGEIEKALGKVTDAKDVLRLTNRPYVEDWKLRKRILEFLKEKQKHGIEPKFVNEPKNYFRRLDENSGIDDFEVNGLYTLETDNGIGIVWENLDFTEDRATYIFKCSEQHYEKQLNWLIDGIKGMAQFRSALLSKMDDPMLPSFKRKYGFVGSIRKRRGRSSSFSNWMLKLEKALALNPPVIPSNEELLKLEELDFQVPHHTMVRIEKERKVGQINPKSLPIKDPDYDVGAKEEIKSSVLGNKIKLLSALKEFNKRFLDEFYPS